MPGHSPSRGELYLAAMGVGEAEPVAVVGIPVRR